MKEEDCESSAFATGDSFLRSISCSAFNPSYLAPLIALFIFIFPSAGSCINDSTS